MSFLNHSPLLPPPTSFRPSDDACHWRMKEHCPVSRAPPLVQGRQEGDGGREREGRLVNYGAIWHRFGFRQLAGVVAAAVEKTTGRPPVGYHASSTSVLRFCTHVDRMLALFIPNQGSLLLSLGWRTMFYMIPSRIH